jgi:hypothetical protein
MLSGGCLIVVIGKLSVDISSLVTGFGSGFESFDNGT